MDSSSFELVERLFHEAAALAPQQRDAFLTRAAPNPTILREVRHLLDADEAERSTNLLDRLLVPPTLSPPTPFAVRLGQLIGAYRLIRELGHGGAGTVYEAEETTSGRHVALKLFNIQHGDAAEHGEALLREARILAHLDHPGIASIHAAGYTDAGSPYFVMELVEGQRLDKYAKRQSRGQRLRVFLQLCTVIQYAHQHGVIHRDLKPSNILVRNLPEDASTDPTIVKILDFGLARLVERDATLTAATVAGLGWGTLPYMSPEQRRGQTLDHRTDIYALGVILFKLMTDELPYPVENLPLPEAWNYIEHQLPRRPSRIDPLLRGDLESIILNAIADEPARRYQNAAELAVDVQRYLSDQRPLRRAPSAFRELARFAKRNRGLAATVLGVIIGLLAVSIGTGWGYMRANRIVDEARLLTSAKRDIAVVIRAEAETVRQDPNTARHAAPETIEREAQRLYELGSLSDVANELKELVDIAEASLPANHVYIPVLRGEHGWCNLQLGRYVQSERSLKMSYDSYILACGPEHERTRSAAQRMINLYLLIGNQKKRLEWTRLAMPDPNALPRPNAPRRPITTSAPNATPEANAVPDPNAAPDPNAGP